MSSSERVLYSERVLPGLGIFAATFFLLPAIALVFEPFDILLGITIGSIAVLAIWGSLIVLAPKIIITESSFQAGAAKIAKAYLGKAEVIGAERIFLERGPNLDPKSYRVFQGSVKAAVKIAIRDSSDPTPYWLISSRKPQRIAEILAG